MTSKRLTNKLSSKILLDSVDYKLVLARYFLNNIETFVPYDFDKTHFYLETNIEMFLFFATSAIDTIVHEINDKFGFYTTGKIFYLNDIEQKLSNVGNEGSIKKIINQYFSKPQHISKNITKRTADSINKKNPVRYSQCVIEIKGKYFYSGWDETNSTLWEIRALRNKVAHNRIINRHVYAGSHTVMRFIFNIKPTGRFSVYEKLVENPQEYFSHSFSDLKKFVKAIRKIVPYSHPSYQHRSRSDLKL